MDKTADQKNSNLLLLQKITRVILQVSSVTVTNFLIKNVVSNVITML